MAGLLSGLANLGLGNLADAKVFEEPKEEKKGCGSVIGVSAVVLTSILGVAFVAKKKD